MVIVSADDARHMSKSILCGCGVPDLHADIQTDLLLEAELRGFASHGLLRLRRIVERIRAGVIVPSKTGSQRWAAKALLEVDGQMGLGPVVALNAVEAISHRAQSTGVAIAAIRNNNHLGMLSWYAERVAEAGKVGIFLSTSEALVHPWGGRAAMIGTNPIAIGLPAKPFPFVMDLATSLVSMGKIHDHANRGESIPSGWALDQDGHPTTDPNAAKSGALAPFGGAKGYALGLGFELLVAILTGSKLGTDIRGTLDSDQVCNKGDVLVVLSPDVPPPFLDYLSSYLAAVRNSPTAEGFQHVAVPGDRSRSCRAERLRDGIPLPHDVWNSLNQLSSDYSMSRTVRAIQ